MRGREGRRPDEGAGEPQQVCQRPAELESKGRELAINSPTAGVDAVTHLGRRGVTIRVVEPDHPCGAVSAERLAEAVGAGAAACTAMADILRRVGGSPSAG